MKHAFSPWRSLYIDSFGAKKKTGCLFCQMLKHPAEDEKNLVLWRGKNCFIVMNRYPYNSGHVMIVPYRHTAKLETLKPEEQLEVMNSLIRCTSMLKKTSKPDGFNIGANIGKVAGAGIDKHIHFHLVPRWNGDTNFMPVLADIKIVSQDIKKHQKIFAKILQED